jgi:hypothetical protein
MTTFFNPKLLGKKEKKKGNEWQWNLKKIGEEMNIRHQNTKLTHSRHLRNWNNEKRNVG